MLKQWLLQKCSYSHYQCQQITQGPWPLIAMQFVSQFLLPIFSAWMLESKYSTMAHTVVFRPPLKLPTIKLWQMLCLAWPFAIILAQQPYLCLSFFTKANIQLLPAHLATIPWCLCTPISCQQKVYTGRCMVFLTCMTIVNAVCTNMRWCTISLI